MLHDLKYLLVEPNDRPLLPLLVDALKLKLLEGLQLTLLLSLHIFLNGLTLSGIDLSLFHNLILVDEEANAFHNLPLKGLFLLYFCFRIGKIINFDYHITMHILSSREISLVSIEKLGYLLLLTWL